MSEERYESEEVAKRPIETHETEVDAVRRKLLRTTAALGGVFAAGQLPYTSPELKSFFGTRSAWAQPSIIPMPVVQVIQPTNLPIVIVLGQTLQNPIKVGSVAAAPAEFADGTFTVTNVGDTTVVFHPPSITGPNAGDFSIVGAKLNGNPDMAPITMAVNDVVEVTVRYTCGVEGVERTATVELDIKTPEGGPVDGVDDVPLSGKCGTLICSLGCSNVESGFCTEDPFHIDLSDGDEVSNPDEMFEIRNMGTLPFEVTNVEISPSTPLIDLTAALGVIAPGDDLEQTVAINCGTYTTTGANYSIVITAESVDLVDGAPVPVLCPPGTIDAECFFNQLT